MSFDSFKLDDVWVNSFKESFSDKEVEALALPSQIVYPGDHNKVLVDITVEYLNPFGLPENGGMRTSTFIKDCLKAYPAMRSQVLLFKWIMSIWGLNKTFTGIALLKNSWTKFLLYQSNGTCIPPTQQNGDT